MSQKRVLPSVTMKQEVDQLLSQGQEGVPLSEFIRASARCCLQAAIEQEATEFLGRARERATAMAITPRIWPVPKGRCECKCPNCVRHKNPSVRSWRKG